jgi:hypothetical protein
MDKRRIDGLERWFALAILVAPVAFFGLFHKTRLHYIGVQYATPDNKTAGILLQGDKDNYRAILVALQGVTGVPIVVGEKARLGRCVTDARISVF